MLGGSSFSLTKILGGISKTLGIVNQAIPIYKELKPMVSNARKLMDIAKEFKSTPANNEKKVEKPSELTSKKEVSVIPTSNPVFFQ